MLCNQYNYHGRLDLGGHFFFFAYNLSRLDEDFIIPLVSVTQASRILVYYYSELKNTAARLVTRSKPSSHITPVLQSLHWLPVDYRLYRL